MDVFKKYELPNDVMKEACSIYKELGSYLNRKNHILKVLFCIYNAYLNLDLTMDILILAYKMKVPRKKVKNVFKLCSPIETGYQFRQVRFTVEQYAKLYLENITNLTRHQKELVMNKYVLDIISKENKRLDDGLLAKEKSQSLAAAIIIYYLEKRKLLEALDEFKRILYRPMSTISTIMSAVGNVLNSDSVHV